MSKYLDVDGYHINKDDFTDEEYRELKNNLCVSPANNMYTDEVIIHKQYHVNDSEIIIPKFYGIKNFGFPKKKKHVPEKAKIKFIGELRDYQIPIVDKCVDHILENGGCQLSVPCGRGKTIMSINIAYRLGLKTLILVHKSFLQDQWITNIKKFTGADAGIIRQKVVEVEGFMFSVGMIQSIGSRDYGDIFRNFGLVICDECHHYASEFFSQSIARVTGAAYTLGLSATLYRKDGLVRVVNWYLGDVAYMEKMKPNDQVCVKVLTYTSTDKERFADKSRYCKGKMVPDCIKMISNLIEIDSRNNVILNIINELRKDPTRKILILSGRKEKHLHVLKDKIDVCLQEDVENGKILKNECQSFLYTGDTKQKDRALAEKNADILFATYGMAQEGLDIDRLNTVILVTSQNDVVQAVGRIMRKILKNGDVRPLIIDLVDNFSSFKSQAIVREKFYEKTKYVMNYYYLLDDEFISPKKFLQTQGYAADDTCDVVPKSLSDVLIIPPVKLIVDDDTSDDDDLTDNCKSKKEKEEKKEEKEKKEKEKEKKKEKNAFDMLDIA
jgi:superfamily II DNA or RNA helicase